MAEQRVQRRLAAILAADVVLGYSGLMDADEEGMLAQLKTLRKELLDPRSLNTAGVSSRPPGHGILIEFPSAVDASSTLSMSSSQSGGKYGRHRGETR